VLVALLVDAGDALPARRNIIVAAGALLHTGDRSYYAGDSVKTWRADTARALAAGGLALLGAPPPAPTGASLADALAGFRNQAGAAGAAYIPPQSDYWALVRDCDGRSLWPMAAAGVPLIDGTVPVQADCKQEFALAGYGPAPATRQDLADDALCQRAKQEGFTQVLRIESVADRARDRRLTCQ
jgi:hypothetical protein